MGSCLRKAMGSFFALLLLLSGWPSTLSAQTGDLAAEVDEDYDAFLESLEGLPPRSKIDYLEGYLSQYPDSTYRNDIESRIAELSALEREPSSDTVSVSRVPLSLEPAEVERRISLRAEYGLPTWGEALIRYDHPLNEKFAVGGALGSLEGFRLLQLDGSYVPWRSPRGHQLVTGGLALRLELGSDSQIEVQPRLSYGLSFDWADLNLTFAPRVRLNALSVGYHGGVGIGRVLGERWWAGLELEGFVRRVMGKRTDLPTDLAELTGMASLVFGARYRLSHSIDIALYSSIPVWYRYRQDYLTALTLYLQYHFSS